MEPNDETIARATLAHCMDGPDAMMYAALKGAPSARVLVEALMERRGAPGAAGEGDSYEPVRQDPGRELKDMFMVGAARWGKRADKEDLDRFRDALVRWMQRMDLLPSMRPDALRSLFTWDGSSWLIAPGQPCWPDQLGDLSERISWASPLCLWGRGDETALVSCEAPLAIVGSRGVNDYGREVAHSVAAHAALRGHLIVSGGAYGTDAAAHWGAIAAAERYPDRAGRTVAVFAGGLDHIGPQRNRELFDRILGASGALVTEMSPGTIPEARRFLLRNRVIAALARTVVVAQARLRSGAINTAMWGADLGREVYAAPGLVTEASHAGCNSLIHDGVAVILVDHEDVTELCHADHQPRDPQAEPQDEPSPDPANDPANGTSATDTGDAGPNTTNAGETAQASQDTLWQAAPESSHPLEEPPGVKPAKAASRRLARGRIPSTKAASRPKPVPPKPTDDQQIVLTAIRSCRRRGMRAGEDEIGAAARKAHPQRAEIGPAWVAGQLGSMELCGLIVRDESGAFKPVERVPSKAASQAQAAVQTASGPGALPVAPEPAASEPALEPAIPEPSPEPAAPTPATGSA
ncbi:DNA-processing protein DprA [Bifidobacterium vespertilionis]|uniref:DNA-processing protein DprA n=1 Tax=Bifidobacterium vespertilionis TaxID=2562524 RepID=UPI001F0A7B83|nr:DNA-processing protein DprA [Bifidobacterium vespertilionis]